MHGAQNILSNNGFRMAKCFCCLSQNAMVCLAHCRQELQQKFWKLQDFFLQLRPRPRPNVQDRTSWSKTKTFIFVLDAPRDKTLVSRTTSLISASGRAGEKWFSLFWPSVDPYIFCSSPKQGRVAWLQLDLLLSCGHKHKRHWPPHRRLELRRPVNIAFVATLRCRKPAPRVEGSILPSCCRLACKRGLRDHMMLACSVSRDGWLRLYIYVFFI